MLFSSNKNMKMTYIYSYIKFVYISLVRILKIRKCMKIYLIICLCLIGLSAIDVHAQSIQHAVVIDGDTIASIQMEEVVIASRRNFEDYEDWYWFQKLRRDIMVVYPYAIEASAVFLEIQEELPNIKKRRKKNKYLKLKEKEIKKVYKDPLKNLTITQGKLLVKIIERQTGTSCYDLIKEFKSPLSAYLWQRVGAIIGYDLKVEFDAEVDKDIEIILSAME